MKNIIFSDLSKKFDMDELPQNYFLLNKKLLHRDEFKAKDLEKIYVVRDNKEKFTCFWTLTKNYFTWGNHP